jgi:hypothetical protein
LEHGKSRLFPNVRRQSNSRTSVDVILFISVFVQVGLTTTRIARDQRLGDLQNYDKASAV